MVERQGVVYCATGPNPQCLFDACFSVLSLRRFYDGNVCLITDFSEPWLRKLLYAGDLDVRYVHVPGDGRFKSRDIKTRLHELTPYDHSVFLDSDTIVMRPIDELFQWDTAMALDLRPTLGEAIRFLSRKDVNDGHQEEMSSTLSSCGRDFPHFNSGVISWRQGDVARALFDKWHHEWCTFRHRDQFALARAIASGVADIQTLSPRFNVYCEKGGPFKRRDTCIWHACHSPFVRYQKLFPRLYQQASRLIKGMHVVAPEQLASRHGTESAIYELLTENPITDANYVAAPWSQLIDQKQLKSVRRVAVNRGFTVCDHKDYRNILPVCRKLGIDTLFTPHLGINRNSKFTAAIRDVSSWVRRKLPGRGRTDPIRICSIPFVSTMEPIHGERDLLYSYVGETVHPVETALLELAVPDDAVIRSIEATTPNDSTSSVDSSDEAWRICCRSRFSICPRGSSPMPSRFWESLRAGAVPVLISDDAVLPEGFNWNTCVVRIAQNDVHSLNERLGKIAADDETYMRRQCRLAARRFEGEQLAQYMSDAYHDSIMVRPTRVARRAA